MIMNKFKNIMTKEHNGSEGFESVILTPLMFLTFVLLLYFLFISLAYISYNNVANNIAQELNMRQSGYKEAIERYPSLPNDILTYRNSNSGELLRSSYLNNSDVIVSPNTQSLASGAYFAIDKHKEQFVIPFTEITKIEIISTKPIDISNSSMTGAVIKVRIHYTNMNTGKPGEGLIPMVAEGYSVIS